MKNNWLRLAQENPEATHNLLCFPFAGGYAEYYLPWRAQLPAHLQLCPVQLAGRSYRWQESMPTDIKELLAQMLNGLDEVLYEKPYVIFGHSMGGYIAYEFCKILLQEKFPLPSLLVVSSLPAPSYWRQRKLLSELSEEEFKVFFLQLGGFHNELLQHENFIKMQMALLRNDILLVESCTHKGESQFPFPILAMGGTDDEYVSITGMKEWQAETKNNFALHEFNGRHFYLNQHLPKVLELINKWTMEHDHVQ